MSQSTPPDRASAPTDRGPKPSRPRGRWRRRILYTLATLAVLAIVLRIALIFILPAVLRNVADTYGLAMTYDRYSLSVLGGNMYLWRLSLAPQAAPDRRVAYVEYIDGDISTWHLLRGKLVVYRAEADGVDLLIERMSDGTIPLLESLLAPAQSSTASSPTGTTNAPAAGEIDLTAPLRLDAFRLQHVNTTFRDHTVSPAVDTTLRMSIRLSDLASADRRTRFELSLHSDPLLDYLLISGSGQAEGRHLDAEMNLLMRGLRPQHARALLEPLGIRPIADDLSLRMGMTLQVEPVEGSTSAVRATLLVDQAQAMADAREAFALDRLHLQATSLDHTAAHLAPIVLQGMRLQAERSPDGLVRFAGIELVPGSRPAASPKPAPAVAEAPPPPAGPAPATQPAPYTWSIEGVELADLTAAFTDHSVAPAAGQALIIDRISLSRIDSSAPDLPLTLTVNGHAKDLARTIELTGRATPFAAAPAGEFDLIVDGVRPKAFQPYFAAAGITSELRDARFTAKVAARAAQGADGTPSIDATLTAVKFSDGDELFAFDGVEVRGLSLAATEIGVSAIEIRGPALTITRHADGTLAAGGLTFSGAPAAITPSASANEASTAATTNPSPATTPPAAPLPRLRVDALDWRDLNFRVLDEMTQPATQLALDEFGVELRNIVIDPNPDAPPAAPGTLRVWAAAKDLVQRLEMRGTLRPGTNAVAIGIDLQGDGITGRKLAPYLASAGIEPVLTDGVLRLQANATITREPDATGLAFNLTNLSFMDAGAELLGLDELQLADARLGSNELSIGQINIVHPRAQVVRRPDGSLQAAGIHVLPSPPATGGAPTPPRAATPRPAEAGAIEAPPAGAETPDLPPAPALVLNRLQISAAELRFLDQQAAGDLTGLADVELDGLVIGRDAPPARLKLTASVPETIQQLNLTGTLHAGLTQQALGIDLSVAGIRKGALGPYLPPGSRLTLQDGRLDARFDAAAATHAAGGQSVRAILSNLRFSDGEPLLSIGSAGIIASRIDPVGGIISIDDIMLTGVQADVEMLADGSSRLLGLELSAAPADDAGQAQQVAAADPAAEALPAEVLPAAAEPAAAEPPAAGPPADAHALARQAQQAAPEITIERINLGIERLSVHDRRRDGSQPLTIADLAVRNEGTIRLLGPAAAEQPPIHLITTGRVDPLIGQIRIDVTAAPFATQPTLEMDLALSGIDGRGVLMLAPEMAEQIDPAGLTAGTFKTHLEASARWQRRGPADFDFSNGVELNLLIDGIEYRAEPEGPVLLGLQEIRADSARIEPARGNVFIKAVEVTRPVIRAQRRGDGLHVLGLVIKPASGGEAPAGNTAAERFPADGVATVDAPPTAASPPGAGASADVGGEVRIDRFLLQGADIRIEDHGVSPPFVLPINNLDIEVRGLTTRAMSEPAPIRFSVLAGSDKVMLPVRGAQGTAERELFAQIAATGRVVLHPAPTGWIKSSVSGFELTSLQGYASAADINLSNGTFDSSLDLRMLEQGVADVRTKLILTDLSVREPPQGPISRFLVLPAPLDVVLGALTDPDGSITLPLNVPIRDGEVSGGAIAGAAVGAVGGVVGTAIASAPMKTVGGVGALVGLDRQRQAIEPVTLMFAPGDTSLTSDARAALVRLVEQLQRDSTLQVTVRHTMGGGDLERAAARANPTEAECRQLAAQLEARKAELAAAREVTALRVRAALASGVIADEQSGVGSLRMLDQALAEIESSLDEVYEMLRPGAERHAARRTRSAALDLGQARLEAVHAAISAMGLPNTAARVTLTRPQLGTPEGTGGGTVALTTVEVKRK